MTGLRQAAKRALERLLLVASRRRPAHGRALVLAYHNVVPDELAQRGDGSLHLGFSDFRRQLDRLQAQGRLVALESLLAGTAGGERPAVAITFDDAYRGAVELAVPELAARGIPVTLFVAPGLLERRSLWWDQLGEIHGGLPASLRQRALEECGGRDEAVRAALLTATGTELPGCYGCASEADLRSLARYPGVTLAAHTWNHPNLARLAGAVLDQELRRPLEWLGSLSLPTLPVLAYPYGLTSAAVEAAAERAGYRAAFRVEGGWFTTVEGAWRLPRFNVPAGLSADGLALRMSGVIALA